MKALSLFLLFFSFIAQAQEIRVGSKAFTEGYLLGELAAQKIETSTDTQVERKFGLGGTGIVIQALMTDEIDVYPEYTGTISEAVLHDLSIRDSEDLQKHLHELGLVMSQELGFENTYALAVRHDFAQAHHLSSISDLKRLQGQIRAAFSHEFVSREDGLKSLERVYGLYFGSNLQAVDHTLAYQSIAENKADLIAVYSTDDKIETLDLVLLKDDQHIFPPYKAVFLAKETFTKREPKAWAALNGLSGTINEKTMRHLNGEVDRDHRSVSTVISNYLGTETHDSSSSPVWKSIRRRTKEHLVLVGVALLISICVGIPLGILSYRYRALGQGVLVSSSLVQTIPSLALLCLLIPPFGIGLKPALVALCLYSLLPVIQNTVIGFQSINPQLLETARALGLSERRILLVIELPLASRSILGGLRTAAIIGIGTATLAALIGAGGYGAPIISGLATNNMPMILTGAIPCAVMALLTYGLFEIANLIFVPKGLRQ
jgi:osmoprotectant transport system permease protein